MPMSELPPFLTKKDVARRYQRSVRSIERDIAAGLFGTVKVSGKVLVPRDEILHFEHRLRLEAANKRQLLLDDATCRNATPFDAA